MQFSYNYVKLTRIQFVFLFFYRMSYNIFMLYNYDDTNVHDINSRITYNGGINLLLNCNLDMSYAKIKEIICYGFGWNYNDINVEITWKCQICEHQYYLVLIVCDDSFKIIIDFFNLKWVEYDNIIYK